MKFLCNVFLFAIIFLFTRADQSFLVFGTSGVRLESVHREQFWNIKKPCVIAAQSGFLFLNGKKIKHKTLIVRSQRHEISLFVNYDSYREPVLLEAKRNGLIVQRLCPKKKKKIFSLKDFSFSDYENTIYADHVVPIRVLLFKRALQEEHDYFFSCESGFKITSSLKTITYKERSLLFSKSIDGCLCINNVAFADGVYRIQPRSNFFLFSGKHYKGVLIILIKNGFVYFINELDLEDYVYSVLCSESWPGWSVEVNKALAITCRSYAVALITRAAKNDFYHIRSSNIHQQYNLYGNHHNQHVKKAVYETRGICLVYKSRPVLAMYDSCCGGVIPALMEDFDFKKAPYLARNYACHYCKKSSLYQWRAIFEKKALVDLLQKSNISCEGISHITIQRKDKSGVVHAIKIKDRKKELIVSGKKVYGLAKEIKSFSFSIVNKRHHIEFYGYGYGHHLGLCQWGACEMIRQGWKFDQVLQFYYPDTALKKIQLKGFCNGKL